MIRNKLHVFGLFRSSLGVASPRAEQRARPLASASLLLLLLSSCDVLNKAGSGGGAPDGNQIILQCNDDDRTNLERDKCKKDAVGNSYTFAGTISDVTSDGKIDVQIDSGNYANVYLSGGGGAKFKKGDNVRFRGKLTFVGSGIMFQHDIKDATLM